MFAVWERFWARTPESGNEAKSHKINGPCIFVCSHNPKVVSSNLTATTKALLRQSFPQTPQPSELTILVLSIGNQKFRPLLSVQSQHSGIVVKRKA